MRARSRILWNKFFETVEGARLGSVMSPEQYKAFQIGFAVACDLVDAETEQKKQPEPILNPPPAAVPVVKKRNQKLKG